MHDDIPWQVFAENGEPIAGKGILKSDFIREPTGVICGASHIWVTRHHEGRGEVLLQQRSTEISSWPGYYDASAAGHIDLGETPLQAAIRESSEEIGITINDSDLELLFVNKKVPNKFGDVSSGTTELQWVYCYKMNQDLQFELNDGEATGLEWAPIDDFFQATFRLEKKIVPYGDEYIAMLASHLHVGEAA